MPEVAVDVVRVVLPTEAVLRVPAERVVVAVVVPALRVPVVRVAVAVLAVERVAVAVLEVERVEVALVRPADAVLRVAVRVAPDVPAVVRVLTLAVRVAVLRVLAVFALPNVRLRLSAAPRVAPAERTEPPPPADDATWRVLRKLVVERISRAFTLPLLRRANERSGLAAAYSRRVTRGHNS